MKHLRTVALLLVILALATPAAAGEWPHAREGFAIGFNVGGGEATDKLDDGGESSTGGGVGAFRLGWAIDDQFLLGLESTAWVGEFETGFGDIDADLTLVASKLNFTWYPSATGWFVRAGFGWGSAEASAEVEGLTVTVEDDGAAFGVGAGHEWRLATKFALGLAADFNSIDLDNEKFEFWGITAQFNWYF